MATGIVKWFNDSKGFGFIAPSTGGKDIFVHIRALERSGISGLDARSAGRRAGSWPCGRARTGWDWS